MTPQPSYQAVTCSIDGCGRKRKKGSRGYCSTHYRFYLQGIPLDRPIMNKRRATPDDRFDSKWTLDPETGCHVWTDHLVTGYGQFRIQRGVQVAAHVYAYERKNGPVPDGLVLDHRCHPADGTCPEGVACRHRACCNPDHLEPATRGVNTLRSFTGITARNARKTYCVHGRPLPPYVPGQERHCNCPRLRRPG